MKQKLIPLLLLCTILLPARVFAFLPPYIDVSSSSHYKNEINLLTDLGVLQGYGNGIVGPEKEITKVELACLFQRALSLNTQEELKNLLSTDLYEHAEDHITAAETVQLTLLALGFADAAESRGGYLKFAEETGLIIPSEWEGIVSFQKNIKRQNAFQLILRMLEVPYRNPETGAYETLLSKQNIVRYRATIGKEQSGNPKHLRLLHVLGTYRLEGGQYRWTDLEPRDISVRCEKQTMEQYVGWTLDVLLQETADGDPVLVACSEQNSILSEPDAFFYDDQAAPWHVLPDGRWRADFRGNHGTLERVIVNPQKLQVYVNDSQDLVVRANLLGGALAALDDPTLLRMLFSSTLPEVQDSPNFTVSFGVHAGTVIEGGYRTDTQETNGVYIMVYQDLVAAEIDAASRTILPAAGEPFRFSGSGEMLSFLDASGAFSSFDAVRPGQGITVFTQSVYPDTIDTSSVQLLPEPLAGTVTHIDSSNGIITIGETDYALEISAAKNITGLKVGQRGTFYTSSRGRIFTWMIDE